MRYRQVVLAFACLLPWAVLAAAQSRGANKQLPASAFQLIAVKVSGTERYKPEDVIRATGLALGRTVDEGNFKDAARILGDTGAFTSVAYQFEYSPEGTKVELQVQDAQQFAPARFDNLVWFSDQELGQKLHSRVPLFTGQLPVTGKLPDDISEALQELVDERKIPGRVDYMRVAQGDGPTEAFVYSVTGPHITVGNIEFSGAAAAELPQLAAAGKKLEGAEYTRSTLLRQEDKNFLPIYLEQGYLKAQFGEPAARVVANDPNDTRVDITVPVVPGKRYTLTSIEFSGNQAVAQEVLRNLVHLPLDQPANAKQLADDVAGMKQFYETRGYMDVRIDSVPQIHELEGSVGYLLNFNEGAVYRMGDLEILGVNSRTRVQLQNSWTLRTGDTYDPGYTRRFVAQALKQILTTGEWGSDIQETRNHKDKTLDVTLRFDPKP